MTVETLKGIRGDEHYTYSGQRWPAKRELSTWVNLRYIDEENRPCDLMIGCAKETSRKRSQWYHRRLHPGPARPTWTYNSSYIRIAANEGASCRGSASFAICITRTSPKNKFASNCSCWAWFWCCDNRWSDGYISHERVLSVTHPGEAIASAASGRISPVHYHHSCNECYISERSFSALLKSYLRTTTLQEHLNYLMLLDVHKKRTDVLDMQAAVVTEFIGESEHRCGIFAAYIWAEWQWRRLMYNLTVIMPTVSWVIWFFLL